MFIDTNLLLLLTVGLTSANLVTKHKSTRTFSTADFDLLLATLGNRPFSILPHVAAETPSLLAQHHDPELTALRRTSAKLLEKSQELSIASADAARVAEYLRLGLTDAAILEGLDGRTLITSDFGLYNAATRRGLRPINFNHLREQAGLV